MTIRLWLQTVLFLLVVSSPVMAAESDHTLSMAVFTRLNAVEKLMVQQDFAKAQKKLDKLVSDPPKRAADRAYVFYSQGTLFLYQEKYKQARSFFKKSYDLQSLNEKTSASVAQTLANLALYFEDYKEAVFYLNDYLAVNSNPEKQVLLALGTAYYQLKEFASVEAPLKDAMQRFAPDKSIHLLLFSSYYEQRKLEKAASVLESVILHWPDEAEHWLQLASIYLERKQVSKSLEVLQLAFTRGLLPEENGILQYVYALYEKGLPFKGAQILSKAIAGKAVKKNYRNYSLLASLYVDAREEKLALDAYINTSDHAKDGKEDLYIAQIYFDQEDWRSSIKHGKKALKKGLKNGGSAHMLIAACYNELGETKPFREHLRAASKFKKSKAMAQQWLASMSQ